MDKILKEIKKEVESRISSDFVQTSVDKENNLVVYFLFSNNKTLSELHYKIFNNILDKADPNKLLILERTGINNNGVTSYFKIFL